MRIASLVIPALLCVAFGCRLSAEDAAKLDDAALMKRLGEIHQALQAEKFAPGEKVAPARVADKLASIDAALAAAAEPNGETALKGRLMRAQVLQLTGDGDGARKAYRSVIADGSGQAVTAGWAMLTMSLAEDGKTDEAEQTVAEAEKAGQPAEVIGHLRGVIASAKLKVGQPFPAFAVKDLQGVERSLASYKGKVLLIDFWATWCGPCVREIPSVKAAYEKHHASGFEILGISLDEDRAKLDAFIAEKALPWPQHFDGKGWETEFSRSFGIKSIPATFLVGPDGVLIAKDLRGDALGEAVAKALAAK